MKADCVRAVTNWSQYPEPKYRFDNAAFDAEAFAKAVPVASPKLKALVDNIIRLDDEDLRKHGHRFKHCIYVDTTSAISGAPLVAAALVASGRFHSAFDHHMVLDPAHLALHKGDCFALVCTSTLYGKNYPVSLRRSVLRMFNKRPDNVHGDSIRVVIIDGGFREGIDLYDTKYCHLFDSIETEAGERQAVGRNTRYCGQSGLTFDPQVGWPLEVYRYTVSLPEDLQQKFASKDMFELYLRSKGVDVARTVFANALEKLTIYGAVDYDLTRAVHTFTVEEPSVIFGGRRKRRKAAKKGQLGPKPPIAKKGFTDMREYIKSRFAKMTWPEATMENMCDKKNKPSETHSVAELNPTQNFVRQYFQPSSAYKGLLLWVSTGAGKTCAAIATATTSWERAGYTIIWVTRHTLKKDIWKNMFETSCSQTLKAKLKEIPDDAADHPLDFISDRWIMPMSFRQFSNMLAGKNEFYQRLVTRNGDKDPLQKTLVIIDEVHKLYDGSLPKMERPDTDLLLQRIQDSYTLSGKQSARLLLMSATPYGDNPMDLIRILNLMREADDQMPTSYDTFADQYLSGGNFTREGTMSYLNKVSGYVSYLNREKDARQFAYPIYHQITVPMSRTDRLQRKMQIAALEEAVEQQRQNIEKNNALKRAVTEKAHVDTNRLMAKCRITQDPIARKKCMNEVKSYYHGLEKQLKNEIVEKINEQDQKKLEALISAREIKRTLGDDISQEAALMDRCELPDQAAGTGLMGPSGPFGQVRNFAHALPLSLVKKAPKKTYVPQIHKSVNLPQIQNPVNAPDVIVSMYSTNPDVKTLAAMAHNTNGIQRFISAAAVAKRAQIEAQEGTKNDEQPVSNPTKNGKKPSSRQGQR
jgi:hemoglobin-like flavoprotein